MKDIIKVSIAKTAFTADREAYEVLNTYLEELAISYKDEEDGNEILEDIEARIAELLIERGAMERIVNIQDISSIIEVLGESPNADIIKGRASEVQKCFYALKEQGNNILTLFGRLVRAFIGIILLIIGLSGVIGGWFLLIGSAVFGEYTPASMIEYINFDVNIFWLKITAVLCYFIPFVAMLYSGIMLITRLKSPKWRPGLILALVWTFSVISFISLGIIGAKPYFNSDMNRKSVALDKGLDTLYINYLNTPSELNSIAHISADSDDLDMVYVVKKSANEMNFVVYPSIRVYRHDTFEGEINYKHHFFSPLSVYEEGSNQMSYENSIIMEGNTINVKPALYSKEVKFNGERAYIAIDIPEDVVVILNKPIEFEFADNNRYKSHGVMPWWFN